MATTLGLELKQLRLMGRAGRAAALKAARQRHIANPVAAAKVLRQLEFGKTIASSKAMREPQHYTCSRCGAEVPDLPMPVLKHQLSHVRRPMAHHRPEPANNQPGKGNR